MNTTIEYQIVLSTIFVALIWDFILIIVCIIRLFYYDFDTLNRLAIVIASINTLTKIELLELLLRTKKEALNGTDKHWDIVYLSAITKYLAANRDLYSIKLFGFTINQSLILNLSITIPINDIKHQLGSFDIEFIDKSLSGACRSTNSCATNLKVLNRGNGMSPNLADRQRFYEIYKNDSEMNRVNIFMCFHPVSMCELFMPFNRTLIVIASTRYELGRHGKEDWQILNKNLQIIASNPRNVIAGNNLYDAEYIRYFTGIKAIVLQSLCDYTNVSYAGNIHQPFLIAPIHNKIFRVLFKSNLTNSLIRLQARVQVGHLREVYVGHYEYSELVRHPGLIYVPYQVSLMSLFEQYRMNIPLFFPSLDLLTDWHYSYRVVADRTWDGVSRNSKKSSVITSALGSDIPDPNNEFDRNAIRYWLQFSDFYQWPHITYFNSIDDLAMKLINTNLTEVSRNMQIHNANLTKTLHEQWRQILERIN